MLLACVLIIFRQLESLSLITMHQKLVSRPRSSPRVHWPSALVEKSWTNLCRNKHRCANLYHRAEHTISSLAFSYNEPEVYQYTSRYKFAISSRTMNILSWNSPRKHWQYTCNGVCRLVHGYWASAKKNRDPALPTSLHWPHLIVNCAARFTYFSRCILPTKCIPIAF